MEGPVAKRRKKENGEEEKIMKSTEIENDAANNESSIKKWEEDVLLDGPFKRDDITIARRLAMKRKYDAMDSEQKDRFAVARRSSLKEKNVKKVMMNVLQGDSTDGKEKFKRDSVIIMQGLGKLFVQEVIETARTIMEEKNEIGQIHPRHLRAAYQKLKSEGKISYGKPKAALKK